MIGENSFVYEKAIEILTSQGKFYINLGLERVQEILQILKNPQKSLKFIHVAGTNGKGSVCTILSSILTESGYKTGLFISPHVFEYTERIKINGVDISKKDFAKELTNIVEIAEKNKIHLTEFEILTVLAFFYFFKNKVDAVILETGLGGRLDATNSIDENICSVITHIDLDHTERLGDSIEKIAYEKAGIIKQNGSVVISELNAGYELIQQVAKEKKAQIILSKEAPKFLQETLALKGDWQRENLALVLAVVDILKEKSFKISENNIIDGLKNVKHPCRFEYLKDKSIVIDGAHNPNGAKALRKSLDEYFPNIKKRFIFGCLNNKNYSEMMKSLFTKEDEIYFYQFKNANSCDLNQLISVCDFFSKPFSEFTIDESYLTVICGSFYMIRELLEKMGIK